MPDAPKLVTGHRRNDMGSEVDNMMIHSKRCVRFSSNICSRTYASTERKGDSARYPAALRGHCPTTPGGSADNTIEERPWGSPGLENGKPGQERDKNNCDAEKKPGRSNAESPAAQTRGANAHGCSFSVPCLPLECARYLERLNTTQAAGIYPGRMTNIIHARSATNPPASHPPTSSGGACANVPPIHR